MSAGNAIPSYLGTGAATCTEGEPSPDYYGNDDLLYGVQVDSTTYSVACICNSCCRSAILWETCTPAAIGIEGSLSAMKDCQPVKSMRWQVASARMKSVRASVQATFYPQAFPSCTSIESSYTAPDLKGKKPEDDLDRCQKGPDFTVGSLALSCAATL